jgi:hypothetical protein
MPSRVMTIKKRVIEKLQLKFKFKKLSIERFNFNLDSTSNQPEIPRIKRAARFPYHMTGFYYYPPPTGLRLAEATIIVLSCLTTSHDLRNN